jgi:hypothetical protein
VIARILTTLANGVSYFTGFAQSDAHFALFISNDNERAEVKTAATFDHFGRTVNEHDLLRQLFAVFTFEIILGRFPTATTLTLATSTTAVMRGMGRLGGLLRLRRLRRLLLCFAAAFYNVGFFSHNISLVKV